MSILLDGRKYMEKNEAGKRNQGMNRGCCNFKWGD